MKSVALSDRNFETSNGNCYSGGEENISVSRKNSNYGSARTRNSGIDYSVVSAGAKLGFSDFFGRRA